METRLDGVILLDPGLLLNVPVWGRRGGTRSWCRAQPGPLVGARTVAGVGDRRPGPGAGARKRCWPGPGEGGGAGTRGP